MAEVFKRHSCQITPCSFLRLSVLIFGLKFHNTPAFFNADVLLCSFFNYTLMGCGCGIGQFLSIISSI